MSHPRHARRVLLVAATCAALLSVDGLTAWAVDPNADADEAALAIQEVAPAADVVTPVQAGSGALVAETDGGLAALTGIGVPITVLAILVAGNLAVDAVFAARYYENGNCFAYLFPRVPVFGLASFWPKQISRGSRNCA